MKSNECKSETDGKKRRSFWAFPFCVCIVLIGFAAVGLRPMLKALEQFYSKESIVPKIPLEEFKVSQLPSFQEGWGFRDAPVLESVGADEHIFTFLTRQDYHIKPQSANLFVTYYSDPKDKVAHSPDVCYRQGGAIVKKLIPVMIDTSVAGQTPSMIPAKLIIFEMPNNTQQVVIFTFYVEGVFRSKRWEVRWKIAKPGNRYTYFSKIESTASFTNEMELKGAIELSKQLLSEAISVLTADYFPSTEDISR